jgi:glycosyltransferase involved in cell wall biosynthesis
METASVQNARGVEAPLSDAAAVRAAIFSTYPPRACGIGTFAFDVRSALLDLRGIDDVFPVAVIDEPSGSQRREVLAPVYQGSRGDYVRAAQLLGRRQIDVVLLEHEFGIYGGANGEYVLSFAWELRQPLVVTLHTVLSDPSPHQLRVLTALCDRAERVIVMTDTARRLLVGRGACGVEKVRVVPHGAPVVLGRRAQEHVVGRRPLQILPARDMCERTRPRFLLSTFGLLSAGKGLETVIEALPAVVERHPEVLYVVAGRTHPQVARREGERYRRVLERLVAELGLGEHVAFVDRFLSLDELADLLAQTDVFLTPYRSREQISSGSLTFALAAGCAAVSTPYWYAQEMLATGAGVTVPFNDAPAVSDALCPFVDRPDLLATARAQARRIGSQLTWPAVASATASVLREAATQTPRRARSRPTALPPPDRIDHHAFDPTTAAPWQTRTTQPREGVSEQ